uniref:Ig-like domain-containing protein n=1 Tax=Gasterosteus aculeatus aculeatus TaxID=481459 RepID=A0AAQ4P342_GASAC
MMGGLALLLLLGTLYPIEAAEVQQVSLTEAELGGNVTFQCSVSEEEKNVLYWYKQPLGCTIQTVATITFTKPTLRTQFNKPRFRVTQDSLTIMNISKEDEATYFCFYGSQFSHSFGDGVFLAVKGTKRTGSSVHTDTACSGSDQEDPIQASCTLRIHNRGTQVVSIVCPKGSELL